MNRDGYTKSMWENIEFHSQKTALDHEIYDVLIVGAGITGLTLGLELQQRGKRCLIIEQKNIGFGTTGGTTAHINTFFDESYDNLISKFGEDKAQTIADHAVKVPDKIKNLVDRYNIECEYDECKFYLFSAEKKQDRQLEKIHEAHEQLDVPCKKVEEIPFEIDFRQAIEIDGQAQFHPLKYIKGLAEAFLAAGGKMVTETRITDHQAKEEYTEVQTKDGISYLGKNLVWATHIPPGLNRFSTLTAPYRSYALSAKLNHTPSVMAQAADLYDPYHYFRYHKSDNQYYLIVGGFDHKTGHEDDTEKPFEDLINYAKENFNIGEITSKWSSQFYAPVDGLPYIGQMPGEEHIYVATGYNGNGMTWGTLAGEIIADLIEGKENELGDIVSPSRIEISASAKEFVKENVDAVFYMIKDQFTAENKSSLEQLQPGEGKVINYDSQRVAVYKAEDGEIKLVSAVCPHMGCIVNFNNSEKTWDCPCHGSRFSTCGELLTGPSLTGLKTLE